MEIGKRTVISIFEHKAAHEPDRVWALRPNNDDDLTQGFESISYQACMNAVNQTVQWLQRSLPESPDSTTFDAFAYQGPSDLRVLLLCLAAAKLGRQIMLPSRRASPSAQRYLVQTARCVAIIVAKRTDPMFDPAEIGAKQIISPELTERLFVEGTAVAPHKGLDKSWTQAQDDPWILLHTSGTTGLPKIVRYTQKMMAKFDAVPPTDEGPTPVEHFSRGAWFTSIPLFHFVGLCIGLQFAPICGSICVAPPAIKDPPVLSAQLRKSVGDKLIENGNTVIYGLGTTEAGGYPQLLRSDKEWDWFTFPEAAGATFERYSGSDVYELVFYKQPHLDRFQQVFLAFPDLDVFRTKDIYYRHPKLKNTWKIAGRSDDFFKLSSGNGIFATPIEEQVLEKGSHLASAVLVGGAGREYPCLLVMPVASAERDDLINRLWPAIEGANRTSAELGHIRRDLVLVADPARPFKMNAKGAVSRQETLGEYERDIETLYSRLST